MRVPHNPEIAFTIRLPKDLGGLLVCYRDGRLTSAGLLRKRVGKGTKEPTRSSGGRRDTNLERSLRADFRAYFSGSKVHFDYPLEDRRFTDFQRAAWAAMREIPYGQTQSYRWVAESIGKPRAYRAVGNACAKNPFLIIQPCHRVVGSRGKLGGFSAGLRLKRTLLTMEGVDVRHLQ